MIIFCVLSVSSWFQLVLLCPMVSSIFPFMMFLRALFSLISFNKILKTCSLLLSSPSSPFSPSSDSSSLHHLLFFSLIFQDSVFLCTSCCPGIRFVEQADLELRVLGLKTCVCTTTISWCFTIPIRFFLLSVGCNVIAPWLGLFGFVFCYLS